VLIGRRRPPSCDNSSFDDSLQRSLLGQMSNQDLQVFPSALDWVNIGTVYTGLGVTAVVTAPVVATVGAAANTEVIITFGDDPRAWKGTEDVIQGLFQPNSRPTTPEGLAIRVVIHILGH
jgi:hypothetical protein